MAKSKKSTDLPELDLNSFFPGMNDDFELDDLSDFSTMFAEEGVKQHKKANAEISKAAVANSKNLLATTPEAEINGWPPSIKGQLTKKEEKLINDKNKESEKKIAALMAQGLTSAEAAGVASYIGGGYEDINRLFWDKDAEENLNKKAEFGLPDAALVAARNKAAASGLAKLPSATLSDINNLAKSKNEISYDGTYPLTHGMRVSNDVADAMYQQHQAILDKGGTKLAGKFLSTSWQPDGNPEFVQKANVVIKVHPKLDGSGSGKIVDQFKGSMFEHEVLYSPKTNFKIINVVKTKAIQSGYVKTMKSQLNEDGMLIDDLLHSGSQPSGLMSWWEDEKPYQLFAKKHGLPLKLKGMTKEDNDQFLAKVKEISKKIPTTEKVEYESYVPGRPAGYEFHYQEI